MGWTINTPSLRIIAPDLRGESTRRQIMGLGGWRMMNAEANRDAEGHTFLMSSVPLVSILEVIMVAIPSMQKYADDLREGHDITALSGEIHLATSATMDSGNGLELNQLVASGVAHRAPPEAWARMLGALSWLGENPLPKNPIRIAPLPGQSSPYTSERNYLLIEREGGNGKRAGISRLAE